MNFHTPPLHNNGLLQFTSTRNRVCVSHGSFNIIGYWKINLIFSFCSEKKKDCGIQWKSPFKKGKVGQNGKGKMKLKIINWSNKIKLCFLLCKP